MRLGLVLEPVIDVELGHSTRAYRALDKDVRLVEEPFRPVVLAWSSH